MTRRLPGRPAALAAAGLLVAGLPALAADAAAGAAAPVTATPGACAAAPPYYAFDLVPTARVPGTARATGEVEVRFAPTPYGVSLADDGSYLLDVTLVLDRLPAAPAGHAWTAWATTTQVDRIERLGPVEDGRARGLVRWNKFLVVVTLEPEGAPAAAGWSGPIVLRGMSRSGMMHTMAGHGPFQQENCAAYGYQD